jgi:hypothetical protein
VAAAAVVLAGIALRSALSPARGLQSHELLEGLEVSAARGGLVAVQPEDGLIGRTGGHENSNVPGVVRGAGALGQEFRAGLEELGLHAGDALELPLRVNSGFPWGQIRK